MPFRFFGPHGLWLIGLMMLFVAASTAGAMRPSGGELPLVHWVLVRLPVNASDRVGASIASTRQLGGDDGPQCHHAQFEVCSRPHSDVAVLCSAAEWLSGDDTATKPALCFDDRHVPTEGGYYVYASDGGVTVPMYYVSDSDVSYRALTFHDDAPHSEQGGGSHGHYAHPQSMKRHVELSFVVPDVFGHVAVRRNTRGLVALGAPEEEPVFGINSASHRGLFQAAASPEEIAQDRGIVVTRLQHLDPHHTRTVTFLASGYTAAQKDKFSSDVQTAMSILRSKGVSRYSPSPWDRYFYLFNIYSIFEPSVESGASRPQGPGFVCPGYANDCGPRETNNNLDCAYGTPSPSRLGCSYEKSKALASFGPASDIIVVLVNDDDYGGTGSDRFACLSVGSGDFPYLLLHEIAHSVGMLGDEYSYGFSDTSGIVLANCAQSSVPSEIPWRHYIQSGQVPATPFAGCSFDNYFRPTDGSCMMASGEPTTLCPVCLDAMASRMLTAGPGLNLAAPMCPPSGFNIYLSAGESATLTLNHRYLLLNADVYVTWTLLDGTNMSGVPSVTVQGSSLTTRTSTVTAIIDDRTSLMAGGRPAAAKQTFVFTLIRRTAADTGLADNQCTASTGVSYTYTGTCTAAEGCDRETVVSLYEANMEGSITADDADKAVKAAAIVFSVIGLIAIVVALGIVIYRKQTNPQSVYEFGTGAKAVWISSAVFACFVLVAVCCAIVYVAQYLPQTVIFGDALFIAGLVLGIFIYLVTLGMFVSILTLSPVFNTICSILLTLLAIGIFIVCMVMCDLVINRNEKDVVERFAEHWRRAASDDPSLICSVQQYFGCSGFYYACSPVLSEYCPANCDSQNRNPNACLPVWQQFVWDELRPAAICGLLLAFLMVVTSILTIVLCCLKRKATATAAGRRSHRKDPHAPVRALTAKEKAQLRAEFKKADKNNSNTLEGDEVISFVRATFPDDTIALDEAEALATGGPKTFEEIVDAYFPYLTKQGGDPHILSQREAEEAETLVELHRLKLAKMDRFVEASGALSPEALEAIYAKNRSAYSDQYGPNVPMRSDGHSPRGIDLDGDGVDDVDGDVLLGDIRSASKAYALTEEGQMLAGLSPQEVEGLRSAWKNLHPSVSGCLTDPEIDRYYQWSHEAVLESREHFVRWKQLLNVRGTGSIGWAEFCFPYTQRALLKAAKESLREAGKEVTTPGVHLNKQAAIEDYGMECTARVFLPFEYDVPIERLVAMGLSMLPK